MYTRSLPVLFCTIVLLLNKTGVSILIAPSQSTQSQRMASQGEIAAVEVYTSNEPAMAKEIEYKGMLLVSKVKSRNMFSDIGSGNVSEWIISN